jgi:hypothetical protein
MVTVTRSATPPGPRQPDREELYVARRDIQRSQGEHLTSGSGHAANVSMNERSRPGPLAVKDIPRRYLPTVASWRDYYKREPAGHGAWVMVCNACGWRSSPKVADDALQQECTLHDAVCPNRS